MESIGNFFNGSRIEFFIAVELMAFGGIPVNVQKRHVVTESIWYQNIRNKTAVKAICTSSSIPLPFKNK